MKDKVIKASRYNEKTELIRLECENCGAELEVVDKGHAICGYCGQTYLVDEAAGLNVGVYFRHDGDERTGKLIKRVLLLLMVFLMLGIIVVMKIIDYNAPVEALQINTDWKYL